MTKKQYYGIMGNINLCTCSILFCLSGATKEPFIAIPAFMFMISTVVYYIAESKSND